MLKTIIITVTLALSCYLAKASNMKLLSFYQTQYSEKSPVIDGSVSDPCWKQAVEYKSYYVYFDPNPGPGKLKTSLRLLWNQQGLFVAIINYDKNIDKIKAVNTTRDNSKMWTDDCAELYFDPTADSVGYTKFIINALGTISDMRQIDAAVKLNEWSASGLEVKTSINKEAWIIEMFIPWDDLGKMPSNGSLWKFCHVRYAWSSGKFIGVTSSPGGNYNNIGDFGFLYFSRSKDTKLENIAQIIKSKAAQPWYLELQGKFITCENDKVEASSLKDIFMAKLKSCEKLCSQIRALKDKNSDTPKIKLLAKYQLTIEKIRKLPNPAFNDVQKLSKLLAKLDELYWQMKFENLLTEIR